jgi:hypothetical protein
VACLIARPLQKIFKKLQKGVDYSPQNAIVLTSDDKFASGRSRSNLPKCVHYQAFACKWGHLGRVMLWYLRFLKKLFLSASALKSSS